MKKQGTWSVTPVILVMGAALLLLAVGSFFLNRVVFYFVAPAVLFILGYALWRLRRLKKDMSRYLSRIAGSLNQMDKDALSNFPLPAAVSSQTGAIMWYNELFRDQVLDGAELIGESVGVITGGAMPADLSRKRFLDVTMKKRRYTVYISPLSVRSATLYTLYYVDDTRLKEIADEYRLSRPAVMVVYIDNLEEIAQNTRESERAQLAGRVENLLEDWIGSTSGVLRKYGSDHFLVILEQRHLQPIIEGKFEILDRVRSVQVGDRFSVTLSIGVGQGETLRESEEMARQALEMALGRGGDQAAVKTRNGFDFYGGVSQGVEKRTKVRTRVVTSALLELMAGSDNVLVMGHRYSDLDCLGSASAMATAARGLGKPAYAVVRRKTTLAGELIRRFDEGGRGDLFIEPEEARELVNRKTLLIITDTHNPQMLEDPELYRSVSSVVVIDHHRKMVDHIDNAVIFYHEPYASSASEMVAEMVQYMGGERLSRLEAEALLAGIMLDTRSFVMKAGVRTFEAAAYLRRLGADTVEVKRLFAESMDTYREKADIISRAQLYRGTAIACCGEQGASETRIAAAQAADELLYIKGVDASFTLFDDRGSINISARSLGGFNVQLVMEAIGGGGHMTMAGAQLPGATMEEARERLIEAIDRQIADREHSQAVQAHAG